MGSAGERQGMLAVTQLTNTADNLSRAFVPHGQSNPG
jgi:hypothetical protein